MLHFSQAGEAEGIVYASKPLSYQGQLIENFSVRFEKGKAVEVKAEKGEELLKTMIAMDDGASYLGECALVPQRSPIAESGVLFYNTLFDENAACHLALGMGFADTIKDFQNKTLDECRALGINDSMIHEDFMIGCDSMNIDGICEDGKVVPHFPERQLGILIGETADAPRFFDFLKKSKKVLAFSDTL